MRSLKPVCFGDLIVSGRPQEERKKELVFEDKRARITGRSVRAFASRIPETLCCAAGGQCGYMCDASPGNVGWRREW